MMIFRKPELVPTLFLALAFGVFCMLGTWQLQRLQWKENILQELDKVQALSTLAGLPQEMESLNYRKAALTGRFLHERTIHMIGRQQGVDIGYYMVTPLVLEDDGRVILVNRGFSPPGKESRPQGLVTVEGMLRPLRQKRYFAPENMPEKNVWTYEDLDKIAAQIGQRPLPLVLEATGKREGGAFPIPNDGRVVFRNDHLGYAITWFSLAAVTVVMFGAYHRKKPN